MSGIELVVREVDLRIRPVQLRLPFRFGASTLTGCPQLFVRVEVEVAGHGTASGFAAEMMVPKWFDKRTQFTPDDNIAQLGQAARSTAEAYLNDAPASAFGLFARHAAALSVQGTAAGFTELTTAFGQAVVDKAVIDALCRALDISFFDVARRNALGLVDTPLVADMAGWNWGHWLASLQPLRRIEARHTIGLLDELDTVRFGADGLPVSLRAVIERYGHRCFKIKLGGNPADDLRRLTEVLAVLDSSVGAFRYTVDGNEQYADLEGLDELLVGISSMKPPLYIEQPVPRELCLETALPTNPVAPLLMDEADGTLGAFLAGRKLGWTGVSTKTCKGLYKSLVNRARCDRWNRDEGGQPRFFLSAEDLTCQAGLAVQQDLALVALLGISHSERNGHHYGDGFGTAPAEEQSAFADAHPDLYTCHDGKARLRIDRGVLAIDSLFAPGYAHSAEPDWAATQSL